MKREFMELARWDLQGAKWSLGESDDVAPRFAAYHIQQSVEKVLKCCLKEMGLSYTKTHRISDLVARLPQEQDLISPSWLEWLRRNAATLYEWESNARYTEGYLVERKFASDVLREATAFYDSVTLSLQVADKLAEEMLRKQHQNSDSSAASRLNLNIKK